jgi:hypothetical protein
MAGNSYEPTHERDLPEQTSNHEYAERDLTQPKPG